MSTEAPLILVIAGGTASGKSTIVSRFVEETGAAHVGHDRYYFDAPQPRGHDFDHPDALDTARLIDDVTSLKSGRPTEIPVYDFASHMRTREQERMDPAPIIVVEGILVLSEPRLVELADLTVFVEAPEQIRLDRRIARDVAERGRTVESVMAQYAATVKPNHDRFVQPSKTSASLIIDGTQSVDESVRLLRATLGC